MTKFWRTKAADKDGKEFYLFTATTDEMLAFDKTTGTPLIEMGKFLSAKKADFSNEESHRLLAAGAFFTHAHNRGITWAEIQDVPKLPDANPVNRVGGKTEGQVTRFVTSIWQQDIVPQP